MAPPIFERNNVNILLFRCSALHRRARRAIVAAPNAHASASFFPRIDPALDIPERPQRGLAGLGEGHNWISTKRPPRDNRRMTMKVNLPLSVARTPKLGTAASQGAVLICGTVS